MPARVCKDLGGLHSGVLSRAALLALPVGVAASAIKIYERTSGDSAVLEWNIKSAGYTAFGGLLGFLLVFRSSQAYGRYWNGCCLQVELVGCFFDAASGLISTTASSKADASKIMEFKQTIVALTSLLTGACFNDIASPEPYSDKQDNIEVLGWQNFDQETRLAMQTSNDKVALAFFWWQCYANTSVHRGIVDVPPPLLSCVFARIGAGLHSYECAKQLSDTPFPYHYTHATIWLLMLYMFITPLAVSPWTTRPTLAFVVSFVLVFVFWALYLISSELEHPFGEDDTDIDLSVKQRRANGQLKLLLAPEASNMAGFSEGRKDGKAEMEPSAGSHVFVREWEHTSTDEESSVVFVGAS